ncbi:MAG: hypothetical protein ACRYFK_03275, partial [Janthinobacterium lividum]
PNADSGWVKAADLHLARNGVGSAVIGERLYVADRLHRPARSPAGGRAATQPAWPWKCFTGKPAYLG